MTRRELILALAMMVARGTYAEQKPMCR